MPNTIKLIVGLGNPGAQYQHTRHNVGADFVDQLNSNNAGNWQLDSKFFGHTSQIHLASSSLRLLIPNTFMNLSGQSVGAIAHFYKIEPEQILVVHDELDLLPGVARFKKGGGHGGHNGLKDIIKSLGNNANFARLRIGIGHPGHAKLVSNFVLSKASQKEQTLIDEACHHALNNIAELCQGKWEQAMQQLHTSC